MKHFGTSGHRIYLATSSKIYYIFKIIPLLTRPFHRLFVLYTTLTVTLADLDWSFWLNEPIRVEPTATSVVTATVLQSQRPSRLQPELRSLRQYSLYSRKNTLRSQECTILMLEEYLYEYLFILFYPLRFYSLFYSLAILFYSILCFPLFQVAYLPFHIINTLPTSHS